MLTACSGLGSLAPSYGEAERLLAEAEPFRAEADAIADAEEARR